MLLSDFKSDLKSEQRRGDSQEPPFSGVCELSQTGIEREPKDHSDAGTDCSPMEGNNNPRNFNRNHLNIINMIIVGLRMSEKLDSPDSKCKSLIVAARCLPATEFTGLA